MIFLFGTTREVEQSFSLYSSNDKFSLSFLDTFLRLWYFVPSSLRCNTNGLCLVEDAATAASLTPRTTFTRASTLLPSPPLFLSSLNYERLSSRGVELRYSSFLIQCTSGFVSPLTCLLCQLMTPLCSMNQTPLTVASLSLCVDTFLLSWKRFFSPVCRLHHTESPRVIPFKFPADVMVNTRTRVMCSISQGK